MVNIILLAPPAAGKGTQASFLCEKYELLHISTGDLLRVSLTGSDDLSLMIKEKMNSGKLVDNNIIIKLIEKKLSDSNIENGIIFDGFPRNIDQANLLVEVLNKFNIKLNYVIYLDVEEEILRKRIIGRLSCPKCHKIYNDNFEAMKPKNDNLCDDCNELLIRRIDDNEETFSTRYDTYLKETKPLINYYKDLGLLYKIDSNNDKCEIFKEICELINN